jgi:tetratricopeptide (TPR) repeat protein
MSTSDADQQIRLCQDFLQKYPTSRFAESVSNRLAEAYFSKNDWAEFYAVSESTLAKDLDDVDVLVLTGWLIPHFYNPSDSVAVDRLALAERYLKHAIQLIPSLAQPADITGEQFAAYQASEMSRAHSGLGLIAFRRQDYATAVQELQQATRSAASPDATDLWAMGSALQQLKRYAEAADAFERCSRVPGDLQDRCKQLAHQAEDEEVHARE